MRGRTDEPLSTDAEVRQRRASRMAELLRKLHGCKEPEAGQEDDLAQWISRCLMAHEVDTLSIVSRADHRLGARDERVKRQEALGGDKGC